MQTREEAIIAQMPKTKSKRNSTLQKMWQKRFIYAIFLPVIAFYLIFHYAPMFNPTTGGVLMAFKHFRLNMDFAYMDWVGFQWFELLFGMPAFWNAFRNTFIISFGRLIFEFPFPIILAIILNEVRRSKPRRFFQTVFTFTHFISWILVLGVLKDFLQVNGLLNNFLGLFGVEPFNYLANDSRGATLAVIFISSIWKTAGWTAIIYLASISGIDPSLYEAADVDGANRWHKIIYITWPGIKSTVIVLLLISIGNMMNAGFEQIFNVMNSLNRPNIDILETYIYHVAFFAQMNQSFAAAAGLFRSVINLTLLFTANFVCRKFFDQGLF